MQVNSLLLGEFYNNINDSCASRCNNSAVIWQNPLSPLLHFSRKSSFTFQVFSKMFLIADFFWFEKNA